MSGRFARQGAAADADAIAAIYNEGIADRIATFETAPRSAAQIAQWFADRHPVTVAGRNGEVLAYAAAFPYRPRPCYEGVREFSVYVARRARGLGHGQDALALLIETARRRGWWKLVSRIFPENAGSRALCSKLGFREVGTYQRHARLDGVWRDVVIVEKLLDT
jgi:L-amino acid N-acyltransferase YncA